MDDVLGRDCGQGGHRSTVVAVLRVVVVFDHQPPVRGPRPLQERAPALRREDDAGRVLVRRGHEHGADRGRGERVDVQPAVVDRDRFEAEPPALQLVAGAAGARVLVADGGDAAAREHLRDQRKALGDPVHDHDLRGIGAHAAGPAQPRRERGAQFEGAARVAVAERVVRGAGEGGAFCAEPGLARERRQVGQAGAQVDGHPGRRRLRPHRGRTGRRGQHTRAAAAPTAEQALVGEPLVGLHDDPARHAELPGQHPRRGQPGARGQTPVGDRVPDGRGEPARQARARARDAGSSCRKSAPRPTWSTATAPAWPCSMGQACPR